MNNIFSIMGGATICSKAISTFLLRFYFSKHMYIFKNTDGVPLETLNLFKWLVSGDKTQVYRNSPTLKCSGSAF